MLAGAIIGAVGLGVIIASKLVEKAVPFCPVCGRRLRLEADFAVCDSCGANIPFSRPSAWVSPGLE